MDVKSVNSSSVMPDKIASLTATLGDSSGEIDLTWDRVAAAKSYVLETAINGGSLLDWKYAMVSTKSKAELTSLQTGIKYQMRVAAIGSANVWVI